MPAPDDMICTPCIETPVFAADDVCELVVIQ